MIISPTAHISAMASQFPRGSKESIIGGLIGAKRVGDMERAAEPERQPIIEAAVHRIQMQRADGVNAALIEFLNANARSR